MFRAVGLALLIASAGPVRAEQVADAPTVTLSVADGNTNVRAGAPIRLVLTFSKAPGYLVETTQSFPPDGLDAIDIQPQAGVFRWIELYRRLNPSWRDYSSVTELRDRSVAVPLMLHDHLMFERPGEYTIRVSTKRLSRATERGFSDAERIVLTSEPLTIRVTVMSETEETEALGRINTHLSFADVQTLEELTAHAEDLAALRGDAATRDKVRWFVNPPDAHVGNFVASVRKGLYMSREPLLIAGMLEARLDDLEIPAHSMALWLSAEMTVWHDLMSAARSSLTLPSPEESQRAVSMRASDLRRRLAERLAQRSGTSRRLTALALLTSRQGAMRAQAPIEPVPPLVRTILIDEFDRFDSGTRQMLIGSYWGVIGDRKLIPSLIRLLREEDQYQHAPVLGRLLELDPVTARPYFIADMVNPKSTTPSDVLAKFVATTLPEIDNALVDVLRATSGATGFMEQMLVTRKAELLARFATASAVAPVLEIYAKNGERLRTQARADILAFIERWQPEAARPLIDWALASSPEASVIKQRLESWRKLRGR
jgi:hypothetical protein